MGGLPNFCKEAKEIPLLSIKSSCGYFILCEVFGLTLEFRHRCISKMILCETQRNVSILGIQKPPDKTTRRALREEVKKRRKTLVGGSVPCGLLRCDS
jgi:hypothetical protein